MKKCKVCQRALMGLVGATVVAGAGYLVARTLIKNIVGVEPWDPDHKSAE